MLANTLSFGPFVTQAAKYRAFISYSHADKRVANWLHQALETYRIPSRLVGKQTAVGVVPKRLTPIFRDRDELPAAGALSVELCKALDQSAFLIVIASRTSAKSIWVNEEVRYYKQVHGESRVLVVIVDGVPGSEDERECFALAVRRHLDEQGQITDASTEPLAADLRAGGDGKRLVKLKLIAGLTGLPLDELVQRDELRKRRTLIGYAAGTTFLAVCMSVLAVMAIRGEMEADQQRAESDSLVEFMLTDLRMQLEPVGRLEIFESVGKRALAYYAKQDIDSLDADSLGRRARALHLVGEVRDLQADTQGALEVFEQAKQTTGELLARDPMNENRIFDHSQSTFWVGYIAWQRNEMDLAEERFLEYHQLATQLVEIQPDKEEWLVEQSSSLLNLGVMMFVGDRHQEAIPFFRQALEIDIKLVQANPENREKKWSMGQGHAWLSDALKGSWEFSAAMAERQKELAIYADILAIDNRDARAREGGSVAYSEIADLNMLAGHYKLALEASQLGLKNIEQLIAEDSSNVLWQDMAVSTANRQVEALMLLGRWEQAQHFNQLALQRSQALVEADPTVISRKTKGLMNTRWMEIAIAFALQDTQEARQKLVRFNQDFGSDPNTPKQDAPVPWFMVYAMTALDKRATGDTEAAQVLIQSLRALQPNQPREITVLHFLQDDSSQLLWPADRVEQAQGVGYNPALILTK